MCGRFTQRYSRREVHAFLGLRGPPRNLRSRYNVAPSQEVAVVRAGNDGRELSMLRRGLIPGWAMTVRAVGTRADSPSNDDPECVEPVTLL